MQVDHICLIHFRNYDKLDFIPHQRANVIVGRNAQGKSALLEALYFLSTSKSHRTNRDSELIQLGSEYARASANVRRETRPDITIEIALSRVQGKSCLIDNKKKNRLPDFVGQLNVVIFSSFDVEMVRGEPALRRRFLDLELSQISAHYLYALSRYRRTLEQRNRALKLVNIGQAHLKTLEPLDQLLATYGASVMVKRGEFLAKLNITAQEAYRGLAAGNEMLEVNYKPCVPMAGGGPEEVMRSLLNGLAEKRDVDIVRGSTSIGPHRDDVEMRINGVGVRDYASQGQQRSTALALKLAEAMIVRESVGESPVLLLDDVCAELDMQRRSGALAFAARGFQSFVTTTSLEELPVGVLGEVGVFEVSAGAVTQL